MVVDWDDPDDPEFVSYLGRLLEEGSSDPVVISGNAFLFTKKFDYGVRKECEKAVLDRGGVLRHSWRTPVYYLVIGGHSDNAAHPPINSAIMSFLEAASRRRGCVVVSESQWVAAL